MQNDRKISLNGLLYLSDFKGVGDIAPNCDLDKLVTSEIQAKSFDLLPLSCGLWVEIESKVRLYNTWLDNVNNCLESGTPEECSAIFPKTSEILDAEKLSMPSVYLDCKGNDRYSMGARQVIAFFTYARYMYSNRLNDTPNGAAMKFGDAAQNMSYSDITAYRDQFFNMGLVAFKSLKDYICRNNIEGIKKPPCKPCGCSPDICKEATDRGTHGTGFKITNVNKSL